VSDLKESNARRLQDLAQQGVGINNLTASRLLHLEETFFGDKTPSREEYEMEWEQKLAQVLDQAESELARAKLLAKQVPGQLSLA